MSEPREDQSELFGDDDLDHASIMANLDKMDADDPSRWPQRLAEMTEVIAATLAAKHEIDKDRSKKIARTLTAGIARYFGGQSFYLPCGEKLDLMLRDKAIWDEFSGHNHKELARKYKLTLTHIYNIIGYQRRLNLKKVQPSLFE